MRVILDSNVICRDFQLAGTTFRVFFDGLVRAGHSLYIPQVVMHEVENKYAEELRDCRARIDRSLAKVRRVSGREIDSPLTDADIQALVEEYHQIVASRFAQVGAAIIDYPDTPHEAVVHRALDRRKPFSESGAGYPDSLIWEGVIDLAAGPGQGIAFVSENRKDFFDGEGNLHGDLVADMEARGLESGRIVAFGSLEEFVNEHIKPTMEALELIRAQLEAGQYPELDLAGAIATYVPAIAVEREWEPWEVGFPPEFEGATLAHVKDIQNLQVPDVHRLHSGEFVVRIIADATCEFVVFISKADYYAMSAQEAPLILDDDWDRHYMVATASALLHVVVEMTFDPTTRRVTSVELLHLG